jgi:hypothetical protein
VDHSCFGVGEKKLAALQATPMDVGAAAIARLCTMLSHHGTTRNRAPFIEIGVRVSVGKLKH